MPRKQRVSQAEIAQLKNPDSRISGRFFTVLVHKAQNTSEMRCFCVVSKKIARKAVDRNRLKRRFREVVRRSLQETPSGMSKICMFIAKKEASQATFQELSNDIVDLLDKARLPKTENSRYNTQQ